MGIAASSVILSTIGDLDETDCCLNERYMAIIMTMMTMILFFSLP